MANTTDFTANIGLPYLLPSQAQKHVTVSESLRALDALVMATVETRMLSAPPASPLEGAAYIIGTGASGVWAGHDGEMAVWQDGTWNFHPPQEGWRVWNKAESALVAYVGGDWAALSGGAGELQNLPLLGIGTAADTANPFSVKANNSLFTARETGEGGTGELRLVLNKETEAGVLSLLMQQGYAAKAELGLIGDNGLAVKVFANDGSARTALKIDSESGVVDSPAGLTISGRQAVSVEAGTRTLLVPSEYADIQTAIDSLGTVLFVGAGNVIVFSAIVDPGDTATGRQFIASNGGVIEASGTHMGGAIFTPAEGTTGNNGAMTI